MDLSQSIEARSDQNERWLPVVGYEGRYEVSDLGHVRSLDRTRSHGRKWRGRTLKPVPMVRGYQSVNLWFDNSPRMCLIHRLVLTAFVGPPPEGMEGLHGDGDSSNNRLDNLSWGTHSENQLDQVAHGTHVNASKDSCPSGHEYTEANTYIYPGRPHRGCRTCRRAHMRAWKAANRHEVKKKEQAA